MADNTGNQINANNQGNANAARSAASGNTGNTGSTQSLEGAGVQNNPNTTQQAQQSQGAMVKQQGSSNPDRAAQAGQQSANSSANSGNMQGQAQGQTGQQSAANGGQAVQPPEEYRPQQQQTANSDASSSDESSNQQQGNIQYVSYQEPKHVGGGWYQLSNGEKVQGKDEAIEAEKELAHDASRAQQQQQSASSSNESSNEQQAHTQEEKPARVQDVTEGMAILAKGPTDANNGAEILRFFKHSGDGKVDIRSNQVLYVGQDLTVEEAQQLLNYNVWTFERVNINNG